MSELPVCVAALYRFAPFDDCERLRDTLANLCATHGIKGTLLLAHEGINGTIAGPQTGIDAVLEHIRTLPGCDRLSVKLSHTAVMPFYRMKVRLKREIVTMGQPDIAPLTDAGTYVSAEDWNALISEPGVIVIDTRNDYEVRIGAFANAVNPHTHSFREFPAWFRANRDALLGGQGNGPSNTPGQPPPKVAMYCTGGIRCEKATAFLKSEGLDAVYHLEGGILKYLETTAEPASLWQGECFVFDQRVAVGHNLVPGTHSLCRACRMPVTPDEQASPLFEAGISCPSCHDQRDAQQRTGYAERQRQVDLAAARGVEHIGSAAKPHEKDAKGYVGVASRTMDADGSWIR
jgi:UPF0176 protein